VEPSGSCSNVTCGPHTIEEVSQFKYLGVIFDPTLSFQLHFEHVLSRVSASVGCLMLIKRYLNLRTFKTLINSFVYSIFDYCFLIWGIVSQSNLTILQSKVNSLLGAFFYPQICNKYQRYNRISHNVENRSFSSPTIDYLELYEICNLLTVSERLDYFRTLFVFKSLKFAYIPEITTNFTFGNSERAQKLSIPSHKSKIFETSPFYQCILAWNKKSVAVRQTDVPLSKFLLSLNDWLINSRMSEFVSC